MFTSIFTIACCITISSVSVVYLRKNLSGKDETTAPTNQSTQHGATKMQEERNDYLNKPVLVTETEDTDYYENKYNQLKKRAKVQAALQLKHKEQWAKQTKNLESAAHAYGAGNLFKPGGQVQPNTVPDAKCVSTVFAQFADGFLQFSRVSDTEYQLTNSMLIFTVMIKGESVLFQIEQTQQVVGEKNKLLLVCVYSHKNEHNVHLVDEVPLKLSGYTNDMILRVQKEFAPNMAATYTNYPPIKIEKEPVVSEKKKDVSLLFQIKNGFRLKVETGHERVPHLFFERKPDMSYQAKTDNFKFIVEVGQDVMHFRVTKTTSYKTVQVLNYQYSFDARKGFFVLNDFTKPKTHATIVDLIEQATLKIELFRATSLFHEERALAKKKLEDEKVRKVDVLDALMKEWWFDETPSIPMKATELIGAKVSPQKVVMSPAIIDLCVEVEQRSESIQENKDFQLLPIDVKHRFETLESDYRKLMDSFVSSSEASHTQKEETVLVALQTISDKFDTIHSTIGELEHKNLLKQLKTIEQR